MIRCLVTDRHRLADPEASFDVARVLLRGQFRTAIKDGVDLIQIRERDLSARDLSALVTDAVESVRGSATRILVNDRLDVALACGADGVHLRSDSFSATAVRAHVPSGFLISRAVHSAAEAAAVQDADYLIAGTVFPTMSKSDALPRLDLKGLRAIVEASPAPVLAIGGITADRIGDVLSTGAAGIAGIGLFLPAGVRFDSPRTAP